MPFHLVGRYEEKKKITFKQIVNFALMPVFAVCAIIANANGEDLTIYNKKALKERLKANCA